MRRGRPRETRGGQVVSFWLGLDEIKILRAWAAYAGHKSLSAAVRMLIRDLGLKFGKEDKSGI